MIRRPLPLLLPLALLLAGCMDRELPTGLVAPEGASFIQTPSGPVVNSLDDVVDAQGCTETHCSLREAIAFASPGATITFSVTGRIETGFLEIMRSLTIAGPGAEQLTIKSAGFDIYRFGQADDVFISGLTITGGEIGGIMHGRGNLMVENSIITGNHGQFGGGIWGDQDAGSLVVRHSTISGNNGIWFAGGITFWGSGSVVIENSTVSDNHVEAGGMFSAGGIGAARLTLTNSTVSGNSAPGYGEAGGVFAGEGSTIVHSTITGNSAGSGAGGIRHSWGTLTIRNNIIANSGSGGDCSGDSVLIDGGYNLVQDGSCISASTSRSGDPRLGPLADNGGLTRTHALLAGSPALDAIPFGTGGCGIGTDQRGFPRPQGGACEIGAFEFQPPTITLSISPSGALTKRTGAAVITGTVTCSSPTSVPLEVSMTQEQTKGKNTTTVTGSGSTTVACSGTTAWSVEVSPESGKFASGAASVSVSVVGTNPPVQASQTVQLR